MAQKRELAEVREGCDVPKTHAERSGRVRVPAARTECQRNSGESDDLVARIRIPAQQQFDHLCLHLVRESVCARARESAFQ